jgi:hypothetical protein
MVVLVRVVVKSVNVPAPVAAILVAVTLTSMGLYGAAKIGLQSKNYVSEPQVTAVLGSDNSSAVLTVTVKAARRSIDELIDVVVIGHRDRLGPNDQYSDQQVVVLGRQTLTPDAAGTIDAQIKFPLIAARYAQIAVRQCDSLPRRVSYCGPSDEVVRVSGSLASVRGRIQGTIVPIGTGNSVQVNLQVSGLQADVKIVTSVERLRNGQLVKVAEATLFVGADGQVAWTLPVAVTGLDEVYLNLQQCLEPDRCGQLTRIAAYAAPA